MKFLNSKLIGFLVAAMLCSCVEDPTNQVIEEQAPVRNAKILNSSANSIVGRLIVKFSEDAIATFTKETTRSAATRSGLATTDAVLDEFGALSIQRLFPYAEKFQEREHAAGLDRWYIVEFDESVNLDAAAEKLAELGEVTFVEFDTKIQHINQSKAEVDDLPEVSTRAEEQFFNDPRLSRQWHYHNTGDESLVTPIIAGCDVNARAAWELCTGDPSIIVAIVDEGVAYSHEDLLANMWVNEAEFNGTAGVDDDGNGYVDDIYGYNFADPKGQISWHKAQDQGHGTHVAGTVAAVNNNGIGIGGVAGGSGKNDGVKMMSCQIFSNGDSSISVVASAIRYAANMGAHIAQCSWGTPSGDPGTDEEYWRFYGPEHEAFGYFQTTPRTSGPLTDGGLAIVAAGNDGAACGYPAADNSLVCVTAIGTDYTPATYSNYGARADITAPGGDYKYHTGDNTGANKAGRVLSCLPAPDNYGYMHGTSMSCPHVSGVAALGLSYAHQLGKKFTVAEFRSLLLGTARNIDSYFEGKKFYVAYTSGTGFAFDGTMIMDNYKGKMGGLADAYALLLAVRGTPALRVNVGEPLTISLSEYFGDVASLVFVVNEVDQEVKDRLGLSYTIDGDQLKITCSKEGSGMITVRTLTTGGITVTRDLGIIARQKVASNGGWL